MLKMKMFLLTENTYAMEKLFDEFSHEITNNGGEIISQFVTPHHVDMPTHDAVAYLFVFYRPGTRSLNR